MTSKVTPGGIESGAPPMFECVRGVVEKVRCDAVVVCRGRVASREERILRLLHAVKEAMVCSTACCRKSGSSHSTLLCSYDLDLVPAGILRPQLCHDLQVQLWVVSGMY